VALCGEDLAGAVRAAVAGENACGWDMSKCQLVASNRLVERQGVVIRRGRRRRRGPGLADASVRRRQTRSGTGRVKNPEARSPDGRMVVGPRN